ncbi:hypothetical protein ACWEKT_28280 [Nocardia takedensis]
MSPVTMPSNVEPNQRPAVARVFADAFTDDAIWTALRPKNPRRAASALYWFYRGEVAICARMNGYLQATYDKQGEPTGALIAYERHSPRFPFWVWLFRIPTILIVGPLRALKMATMLSKVEAAHPTQPHFYFWYAGSRILGGGTVLVKRVMKVARQKGLPCYGEAKSADMTQMLEILGWQAQAPIDLGEGHKVTPVWWLPAPAEGVR